ncbi:MAG TPA: hypothetical protein EYH56_00595 [Nanoarchaeota archaeon]|nr:hypothetical protein [Nanoarchaeota archaeon]
MKKALKISLFIGTTISVSFLYLLKFLQPITQMHLLVLSYAIILSSIISGIYVFKKVSEEAKNKNLSNNKFLVKIETVNGKKIEGILSHISHGFIFLENCICDFKHFEEMSIPLNEVKNLEIK